MKYLLVLYFMSGDQIIQAEPVKVFETKMQCERFLEQEPSLERMDIYLKYYRENKEKLQKNKYGMTMDCKRIPRYYTL